MGNFREAIQNIPLVGQTANIWALPNQEPTLSRYENMMGVVKPAAIQPGDVAGVVAGSLVHPTGRAILASERGAIGESEDAVLRRLISQTKAQAERYRGAVAEADAAGGTDYSGILSTGSKERFKTPGAYRSKILQYAENLDKKAAEYEAELAASGQGAKP